MKNKNTDIYKVSVNDCQKDKQKTYDQQGKINCGASSEPDFIQNYFCNQNFWAKRYLLYNNTTFSRFWSQIFKTQKNVGSFGIGRLIPIEFITWFY